MPFHIVVFYFRCLCGFVLLLAAAKTVYPMVVQRGREKREHEVDEYLRQIDPDYTPRVSKSGL